MLLRQQSLQIKSSTETPLQQVYGFLHAFGQSGGDTPYTRFIERCRFPLYQSEQNRFVHAVKHHRVRFPSINIRQHILSTIKQQFNRITSNAVHAFITIFWGGESHS